jgi:hypothetical protein
MKVTLRLESAKAISNASLSDITSLVQVASCRLQVVGK